MNEELNIQMYSSKKLPSREFELPGDPYETSEEGLKAKEYLRQLGVFFYRDEHHSSGIVIDPPNVPCNGYYHQGILDSDILEVTEWEDPPFNYIEKHGDEKCWQMFNREVVVIEINSESLRVQL